MLPHLQKEDTTTTTTNKADTLANWHNRHHDMQLFTSFQAAHYAERLLCSLIYLRAMLEYKKDDDNLELAE